MPADVLPSNSLHGCLSLRRCLMPGGLRSCFLFWCFVFASVQDLVIQWHHRPAPIGVVWSGLSSLFLFFGCFLFLCGFCFFLVSWFSRCFGPDLTSDCVMVPTPLSTPNAGHSNCICLIRSSARQCAKTWQEPQRRRTEKKNAMSENSNPVTEQSLRQNLGRPDRRHIPPRTRP